MHEVINNGQFEAIYCINLACRGDRKANAMKEFRKRRISNVKFFTAVDGLHMGYQSLYWKISPGMMGCFQSHLKVLKEAYENGFHSFLVFEDDIKFEDGFDELIGDQIAAVPADWNFLYLGWADYQGFEATLDTMINDYVCIPRQPFGLFAYAVRGREFMQEMITFMEARWEDMRNQYDEYLCFEMWPNTKHKMYALMPPLIGYNALGTNVQTAPKHQPLL